MNTERPTPETDAFYNGQCLRFETKRQRDFARRLERERDEAREREARWKAVAQMYRGAFDPDELTDQLSILDDADNAFDALRSEVEG